MKRLSTHCMNDLENNTQAQATAKADAGKPRKQTLDFLMQFARAYQAEPALNAEVCGYVLN